MGFNIKKYLNKYSEASTLAFFRLAFGFMMVLSLIRFVSYGWIEKFYIQPPFHFTYYGFEWVKPLGNYTYLMFFISGLASLFVAIGYKYKLSIITFFLSFTYIEFMDKTTYLNHYYFITVVSFIMIFLPANAYFSIDAYRNPKKAFQKIPSWSIDILKLLLGVVYFYAGLAKLNSDWLFEAMPLKIWLPNNSNLPIIGSLLNENWVHYAFCWTGMIYDLSIPFLLLYKRTRLFAFVLVVVFHLLTKILFPIGVFPYIMIVSSLLFFDAEFHKKCLQIVLKLFNFSIAVFDNGKEKIQNFNWIYKTTIAFLTCFIALQLLLPFRYLLYPGELFWTEEGFRFSWRVMLMEKAGYTQFIVTDSETKENTMVDNSLFLTAFQEKQMSFQPDFILEYAHFLHDYYQKQGIHDPEVRVQSYVALNGRLSKLYIDPKINLAKENETFNHKTWILPFNDEIKGF
ncbi:HTTM domain-containing protein [Flavobacterium sp. GT3R68]|uniref:HTTM domain-containing protein n=1 Tax=Flavobacterium sp. GT3R68 TaxID=2594437 RepID=UPI000F87549B|nr:HTTM domain-containing protein [Flavobacterium sp. GT3R68]RTY95364.1 HTTM domain-containing protein [Flavobacterium sp. GSN2]TRW90896.1 HTTM domain-containing protein [Flavobacterium sp. GT3R68]